MDNRLTDGIKRSTAQFNNLVSDLTKEAFEASFAGKWTAGQDLHHLVKSLRLIVFVYSLPLVLFRVLYGTPNRRSRSEGEIRDRYRKAIGKGVRAPRILKPGRVSLERREALMRRHAELSARLCSQVERLGDERLDGYLVKHPAIGKVTLREFAMLTGLHTAHHTYLLKAKLSGTSAEEL